MKTLIIKTFIVSVTMFYGNAIGKDNKLPYIDDGAKEMKNSIKVLKFETQTFYGDAVKTNNWHNVTDIQGPNDYDKKKVFAGAVFEKYILTVTAPKGWHFVKDAVPRVNCVRNNEGAFEWNRFDVAKDRVYQNSRTSNYIEYSVWAGSRPMEINLACEAVKDN